MISLQRSVWILLIAFCLALYVDISQHPDLPTGLNATSLIKQFGYPLEIHEVTTQDGYILTLHRIPYTTANKKGSVLLMHGLLATSTDWVSLGAEKSLPLLLSRKGYDVWLGNARGTTWSMKHTHFDPEKDAKQYWNFCWDEIATYDLPAIIDYVLNVSNNTKLVYIGHSQGATTFFAMTSYHPEYNEKIRVSVCFAPSVTLYTRFNQFLNSFLKTLVDIVEKMTNFFDMYELMPFRKIRMDFQRSFCKGNWTKKICTYLLFAPSGVFDVSRFNMSTLPVIFTILPDTASLRQMYHYFQVSLTGKFQMYDYGKERNYLKYGSEQPPLYNLDNVVAPLGLYYASNDLSVRTYEVERLYNAVKKSVKRMHLIPFTDFNHIDFLYAIDVPELLYNDVISFISQY